VNHQALIVDDSLTVRMDLAEALEAAGLNPVLCATLAEARAALLGGTFALVVLDVLLPDGDGIDLLAEIRAAPAHDATRVMLLSTEAEVRDRVRGLATGADEYIGKPYDSSYVVARARELLEQSPARALHAQATVLVIDDSATFREALAVALEQAGHSVLMASTGEDGLRIAARARPSAIVVDGLLPGIDGATVIRRIRLDAALRRTPCILLTASEERTAEVAALDAGADTFVRKDEDVAVLLARLAAVLRSSGTHTGDEVAKSLLGPKKILAVDDSPTYLETLGDVLRGDGYEPVLARSGEEALELLAIQSVDCILLDLLMPGIGGEETCRRIKANPATRDTPVVMLTALEDAAAMIRGLGAGADDYISKASDAQVLKARVIAQLRRKQFEDENRRIRDELLRKEIEAAEARAARELAETRARLLEDVEQKNRELEAFSYSVSHDLRAPLRRIDGFAKVILEGYAERLDPHGQDILKRLQGAAHRMGELIDDLLQLSLVGRADVRCERVNLSHLADLVVAELRAANAGRRVTVSIEDDVMAEGDPRLLRVVLDNLLGNAWKFTRQSDDATISFGLTRKDDNPMYFVEDNGAGFDMQHAHKLFAPFQRLHAARDFPGTGIGLATVRRIIERHGGRIAAEGRTGHGARFSWTLASAEEGAQVGVTEVSA
jgi:two-component system, NtrC family, sensor kinase